MKVLFAGMVLVSALFIVFRNKSIVLPAQSFLINHPLRSLSNDTISFILQIQPILVNHCSPCHFTGGRMYEKLPFDKGETIVNHEVALLRRINDVKEKALIQKFIQEQKK